MYTILALQEAVSEFTTLNLHGDTLDTSLGTLLRLSAALGVTVDTLLRGNQPAEANAFYSDVQPLLDDCSQKERKVLLEIAAAVKQILRDAA